MFGIKEPSDVYSMAMQTEKFFTSRNMRITQFRDLVRQIDWKQRNKSGNYHKFEGNESGSFFQTMVQILARNPIRHRIPYDTADEKDRELKGSVERLVLSTYRDVDAQRPKNMASSKLQTAIGQFICSDGWICAEVKKNNEDSNKPLVDIQLHDNLDANAMWGPDGLQAVVIKSQRTKLQVALEYPNANLDKKYNSKTGKHANWSNDLSVDVYCCYFKEGKDVYYCSVVNGEWGIKPYVLSWINEIPCAVTPVNGLPYRTNKRYSFKAPDDSPNTYTEYLYQTDWTIDAGRGVFFMNMDLYSKFNELWAMVMDITDTEARGTYFKETEEGEDNDIIIGRGRDAVNALKTGDKMGRLPPGGLGPEVIEALSAMGGMLQRGGISWALMGQAPGQETSGFALGQLISAALTIAVPYSEGMEFIYQTLDDFIVKAYQSESGKTTIRAWRENVSFVEEEVDLDAIKDKKFYFECKLKPGLPDDLARKINIGAAAKQARLLDDLTILDEVLEVDDPELIMERRLEMDVLNLPSVQLRRAAAQRIEAGDMAGAAAVLQELMLIQGSQQLQQGQIDAQLMQLQQMLNPGSVSPETGMGGVGLAGGAPGAMGPNEPSPEMNMLETTGGAPQAEGLPPEALPAQERGIMPQFLQSLMGRLRSR